MSPQFYGWNIHLGSRSYKAALGWQERMVRYRLHGTIRDTLFFVEHPHCVTIGRDCPDKDVSRVSKDTEIHHITRGGGLTYHGPGQLVVYPVFDLARRGKDLRAFIYNLEQGIIDAFKAFGLDCNHDPDHTGVWVGKKKIASIGIAVSHWISYHGAAINLTTDLNKFTMINPCGLDPKIMTTAERELGKKIAFDEFAAQLSEAFGTVFDTAFYDCDLEELIEIVGMEESTQSM